MNKDLHTCIYCRKKFKIEEKYLNHIGKCNYNPHTKEKGVTAD